MVWGKWHQAEKCRFKKDAEAKEAEIKAKKTDYSKKKKTKKQAMKKKKKEGANKATVDLPGTGPVTGADTSSSSEEQNSLPSSKLGPGARELTSKG